ncbi:SagB-type dehydrogenase family enzyme [Streptomyces achromogenes]|uniref:SagB-type dehydrogenase family enzyme n=1 Tax=Streptomyces achromogenes TaxID=67255 RepID=A0ABU0Q3X3_STRAH|nr:SagB-type dehydrogenase family enzyme [Streptomyces achromogenes]MDQ0832524.1 SagB-type dehydrogenase family enzyme [Streptomyces achromogenes]
MHLGSLAPQLVNLWSLRQDIVVDPDTDPEEALLLETPWEDLRIKEPSAALREAVRRMQLGPSAIPNILASASDSPGGAEKLLDELRPLQHLVVRTLAVGAVPLLSVVPISGQARFTRLKPLLGRVCRLSRFAVIRCAPGGLSVESSLVDHKVELHHPGVMGMLGRIDGSADDFDAPHLPVVEAVRSYLVAAGVLVVADEPAGHGPGGDGPVFAEDRDPALTGWSPDELMVHSGSRRERFGRPRGAAFAQVGRMPPPPVVKPPAAADPGRPAHRITLARPDLDGPAAADASLTAVLEPGARPAVEDGELSLDRLGALLYRAARVRAMLPPADFDPAGYPTSERPYLSVDDSYALEVYVLADEGASCLPPGAYHYRPLDHCLERMGGDPGAAADLAGAARSGEAGPDGEPTVLIAISARFARAAYKFSGTAYTNVLKDVGALQQTLTLVARAMGLQSRVLPVGDADAFQRAVGMDWRVESSVGDMAISSRIPPS